MYARVVTFTGVNDIDGAIRTVRQEVLPLLAGQSGYRGLSVSAERAGRFPAGFGSERLRRARSNPASQLHELPARHSWIASHLRGPDTRW